MSKSVDNAALVKAAEEFLAAAKSFDGDSGARSALAKKADTLRWLSEDAGDTLFRQWEAMHLTAAMTTLVKCDVLKNIPRKGTIGCKELADASNLDESVVKRAMAIICIQGIGEEVSPMIYAHNAKSLAYVTGNGPDFFQFTLDWAQMYQKFPEYFRTHAKDAIYDPKQSPYAYASGSEGKTFYEALMADPEKVAVFNGAMTQIEEFVPTLGMFPFAAMREQVEAEPERPFIVDVGGNVGHDLISIQKEAPAGFGAPMILQDRPDVIADIAPESIPNITKMAHDFFTPQPIKNAHLYFLRRVIHNFNDDDCKVILKQIAVAMGPTSRLLVGEFILPDQAKMGGDFTLRWMDFCMITISGKERTRKQFEELFDYAGLELVKVWPFVGLGYPQCVIEAKLKHS